MSYDLMHNRKITGKNEYNAFHNWALLIAAVVYTITAINSKGYYHYDEHYQIIEFAGLKLGLNHASDLAWEYGARIRPAFQPAFAFVIFKALHALGISDVYTMALVLRLLTSILALGAIRLFILSSLKLVGTKYQRSYILLSYFLWFLPFLNVRYSSESWSGLLFLMAVALVQSNAFKKRYQILLIGLLLSLSFLCRFQAAFLIVGLLSWLVFIKRLSWKSIALISLSFCFGVALGVGIDSWFYGEFVFTPWNYFRVNLIEDVAAQFGTAPWYYYLEWLLYGPSLPIGSVLFISLFIVIYQNPKHILIWIILPFLIAHSAIAHKEYRFLFPLINFAPLLLILGWQEVKGHLDHFKGLGYRYLTYFLVIIMLITNIGGLATTSLTAAGPGTKTITHYIHKNYRGQPVHLICQPNVYPYNPLYWIPLKEGFYKDKNVTEVDLEEMLTSNIEPPKGALTLWALNKEATENPEFLPLKEKYQLKKLTQSLPVWAEWIMRYHNPDVNKKTIVLYITQKQTNVP